MKHGGHIRHAEERRAYDEQLHSTRDNNPQRYSYNPDETEMHRLGREERFQEGLASGLGGLGLLGALRLDALLLDYRGVSGRDDVAMCARTHAAPVS